MTAFFPSTPAIVDSDRILYTASSFARSALLHLQEIGELKALQAHTSKRENLDSYLFFMIEKGSGKLKYQGKQYDLTAGTCAFIDCKQPYSHTTDEDLWTIRWIHFNGPAMDSVYRKYCDRGGRPTFIPESLEKVNSTWQKLMTAAKSSDYMRDMKINTYLSDLLVSIMAESWHPEDKSNTLKRTGVSEIRDYLNEHYAERISVEDLAGRFLISSSYLAHSFKEQYGVSLTAYLMSVRITHAKQMLRFTNKSIEEIGYAVGIGAPAYFSRVFKQVEGVTPSTYREQW